MNKIDVDIDVGNGVEEQEVENGNGNGHHTPRHRWSLEEMRFVAAEIAALMKKQGFRHIPDEDDREGRRFMTDFFATAQLTLPRERRMMRKGWSMVNPVLKKFVSDALTNRNQNQIAQSAPIVETKPEQSPSTNGQPEPAAHPVPPNGYALVDAEAPLAKAPLGALLAEVCRRVVEEQEDSAKRIRALEQTVEMLTEDLHQAHEREKQIMTRLASAETILQIVPEKPAKLPVVAIMGCRAYEMEHIKHGAETMGLKLEFKHYNQDDSPRKVHADYVLSLKWLSHGWANTIALTVPKERFAFLNGGIGMAIKQLQAWFQPDTV